MKLTTVRQLCRNIAEHYYNKYISFNLNTGSVLDRRHRRIYNLLTALNKSGSKEQIDALTSEPQLTTIFCDQCGDSVDKIIVFGVDGGDTFGGFCSDCLEKAIALMRESYGLDS